MALDKLDVKVGQRVFISGRPEYRGGPRYGWFTVEKVGRLWITCDGTRFSVIDGKAEYLGYGSREGRLHLNPDAYLRKQWGSACLSLLQNTLPRYGHCPFTPEQLAAALQALGITPPEPPTLEDLKK